MLEAPVKKKSHTERELRVSHTYTHTPVIRASARYIASSELHSQGVSCHNSSVKQPVMYIPFVHEDSRIKL